MKKKTLLSLLSLISLIGFSQITQEHFLVSNNIYDAGLITLENSGDKYFVVDQNNFTIKLYNTDHSIFKTIQIDSVDLVTVGYPNFGGGLLPWYMSENLFDLDSGVEFLVYVYIYNSASTSHINKAIIFDEDGSVLFSKQDVKMAAMDYENRCIKTTDDGTKMLLMNGDNDSLFVYSLPGEVPCYDCNTSVNINKIKSNNARMHSYPNPAKAYITIKYEIPGGEKDAELLIFDAKGKQVNSYKIDRTFKDLRISTSGMSSGNYFYIMKTSSGIVGSKKMIIIK